MSHNYTKPDLIAHLESIMPEGYTLNNPQSYEPFKYSQDLSDRTYWLSIVDTRDFPIDVQFKGLITLSVAFKAVEDIVDFACENALNSPYPVKDDNYTFQVVLRPDSGKEEEMRIWENSVSNDESFENIRTALEDLISKALNFINTHPTLLDWFEYFESLSSVNEQQLTLAQPFTARNMIMKKLFNRSDYADYASARITYCQNNGHVDEGNFLQTVKDKLDTL